MICVFNFCQKLRKNYGRKCYRYQNKTIEIKTIKILSKAGIDKAVEAKEDLGR